MLLRSECGTHPTPLVLPWFVVLWGEAGLPTETLLAESIISRPSSSWSTVPHVQHTFCGASPLAESSDAGLQVRPWSWSRPPFRTAIVMFWASGAELSLARSFSFRVLGKYLLCHSPISLSNE